MLGAITWLLRLEIRWILVSTLPQKPTATAPLFADKPSGYRVQGSHFFEVGTVWSARSCV